MRLVLSGYYGYGNAGDEAVLAGLLRTMREIDPRLEAVVVSGNPAVTERAHGVAAVLRRSLRATWHALRSADGLVSGGGSLLQDVTSARPVAYYTGIMATARAARRPYAIHAQGLGPIHRRPNRWLARTALERAAHVSLRDPDSIQLARTLGVRRPIELAPDAALALRPDAAGPGDRVVVAVRDWQANDHLAPVRAALAALAADRPIIAVPMQEPADRAASAAAVAGIDHASVLAADTTLDERLRTIASARVVIGMRLHALILAAAAGVPAVAISYDPKVDAWARMAGQAIAGDVRTGLDPERIVRAANETMAADPAPYLERVAELRASVRSSVEATLAAIDAGR